jgi:hypothetical protein
MAHISTFRGSEMGLVSQQEGLPSFFEYYSLLAKITPTGEQFFPVFIKHPDGEHTVVDFYPPPPIPSGPSGTESPSTSV